MGILAIRADERVKNVYFTEETINVDLMDGRAITVPLVWYPRLLNATPNQRLNWEVCGGGYGIGVISTRISAQKGCSVAHLPQFKQGVSRLTCVPTVDWLAD
jgi:hypothetical protein